MMITSFSRRFIELALLKSPFCLGIDPTKEILHSWGLTDDANGLKTMCEIIIEAAGGSLAVVKPQSAYFERFGPQGAVILKNLTEAFSSQGTLVLLDAKRGDIGSTSMAYAEAYLGAQSAYKFDALTITAYLGFDAIKPILEYAAETGTGVFIVTRSSNKDAELLQNALISEDGNMLPLAAYLAKQITLFNKSVSDEKLGPIGAVMGATLKNEDIADVLDHLTHSLMLSPGIGYQGASIDDVLENYKGMTHRIIPSSSRGVLLKGPNIKALKDEIKYNRKEAYRLIQ